MVIKESSGNTANPLHHMEKITDKQKPWILAGYTIFAKEGPGGLKVEVLAREVSKSKSSFYHHFADLEIYIDFLLMYHIERSQLISEEEKQCKNVVPELLEVFLNFKEDLLFNRQLRVHREVPKYRTCLEKSSEEVGTAILGIWSEHLGLRDNSPLAMMVLNLTIENFYLQITDETLRSEFLSSNHR